MATGPGEVAPDQSAEATIEQDIQTHARSVLDLLSLSPDGQLTGQTKAVSHGSADFPNDQRQQVHRGRIFNKSTAVITFSEGLEGADTGSYPVVLTLQTRQLFGRSRMSYSLVYRTPNVLTKQITLWRNKDGTIEYSEPDVSLSEHGLDLWNSAHVLPDTLECLHVIGRVLHGLVPVPYVHYDSRGHDSMLAVPRMGYTGS